MPKKKILLFSLAYLPHVGGAEIAVKEITDRISDIEFRMITLRFDRGQAKEEKVGNVFVHRVGNSSSYFSKILFIPRAASVARKLHKKQQFDALWAVMSYMVLPVIVLRIFGVDLPYVLTLQDGDPFEHVFNRPHIFPFKPLLKSGFKHATVVQVISNYLGLWARKVGYKGPLEVIPNGVDTRRFTETVRHEDRQTVWRNVEMRMNDVILITTSRLVHKNAIDVVIRALALLPKGVSFMVVGIGPEFYRLEALAKELGASNRTHFVGEIQNTVLARFLHASDIFVRPSRSEGLGTSFLEAMAAGLPVIATQVGGIADFLFDEKRNPEKPTTGWAVDVDSPEQIAEAVKEILSNPEQTKLVIENAKRLVVDKYDWNLIAKDMQTKVFDKVLKTS